MTCLQLDGEVEEWLQAVSLGSATTVSIIIAVR
jgi:hypothetical protein